MKPKKFRRQEDSRIANTPENQSVNTVGRRRLLGIGSLAASGLVIAGARGNGRVIATVSDETQASLGTDQPTEHQRTYYSKARF